MCQLSSEGGRRCADYDRLKASPAAHFAPERVEGVPDVAWRDDDLQELWANDADKRAGTCAALMVMEKAKNQEPAITLAVMEAAAASGSECAHLEQRMKYPASLVKKVLNEQESAAKVGQPLSPTQTAGEVTDMVRYTVVHPDHRQLVGAAKRTVEVLQNQGWVIQRFKSTYAEAAAYQGAHIHIVGISPGKIASEVQVHSAASLSIKNQSHKAYEVYRDGTKSKQERRAAMQECIRLASTLETPIVPDKLTGQKESSVSKS